MLDIFWDRSNPVKSHKHPCYNFINLKIIPNITVFWKLLSCHFSVGLELLFQFPSFWRRRKLKSSIIFSFLASHSCKFWELCNPMARCIFAFNLTAVFYKYLLKTKEENYKFFITEENCLKLCLHSVKMASLAYTYAA